MLLLVVQLILLKVLIMTTWPSSTSSPLFFLWDYWDSATFTFSANQHAFTFDCSLEQRTIYLVHLIYIVFCDHIDFNAPIIIIIYIMNTCSISNKSD